MDSFTALAEPRDQIDQVARRLAVELVSGHLLIASKSLQAACERLHLALLDAMRGPAVNPATSATDAGEWAAKR
jgi:hypothetical protein